MKSRDRYCRIRGRDVRDSKKQRQRGAETKIAQTEDQRRKIQIQRNAETETEETERKRYGQSRDRKVCKGV